MHHLTTVLETIPKPLIAKAQTALGKQKKKNKKIRRRTTFNMADGIHPPSNVACGFGIMTLNSPGGNTRDEVCCANTGAQVELYFA